jgi:hypothetical protein
MIVLCGANRRCGAGAVAAMCKRTMHCGGGAGGRCRVAERFLDRYFTKIFLAEMANDSFLEYS